MIPFYYALIAAGAGALCGSVLTIVFRPSYDRLAEYAETLTADKAQAVANHFAAIAQELRKPGK